MNFSEGFVFYTIHNIVGVSRFAHNEEVLSLFVIKITLWPQAVPSHHHRISLPCCREYSDTISNSEIKYFISHQTISLICNDLLLWGYTVSHAINYMTLSPIGSIIIVLLGGQLNYFITLWYWPTQPSDPSRLERPL